MRTHPARLDRAGEGSRQQALRTVLLVAIVVGGNLLGNILLRASMRRAPALPSLSPMPYLQALVEPRAFAGVLLLILGFASQLALLSWADLSYVGPVTSIGYVLTALAGKLFLHEPLSTPRWAAILLIAGGVALVARTPPSTAAREPHGGLR